MKLFGKIIAWKIKKQDIVTILFTKIKFLAISSIEKKTICFSHSIKIFKLFLLEVFIIKYNNKYIIRLLVDKSWKLQTKLYHINIHSYLLR